MMKKQSGVTLIALVVTIVVLIILATISINAVFSENGIIKRAEQARDASANAVVKEEEDLDEILQQFNNAMADPPEPDPPAEYVDNSLPTAPKLDETVTNGKAAMTPVKWNGTNWIKVTDITEEWYNYENKEWANVVLGDATFNADGTLDESKAYTQLVWIPRFAYKIETQYHTGGSGAGNIDVVFIDANNQNKNKTTTYGTTYTGGTAGGASNEYVVHPAFDYGGTKLTGFWMGKFESSHTGCTTDKTTGTSNTNTTDLTMMVKAGVTSWRSIRITNMFDVCLNMNKAGNVYGLNTSDSVVDPHMTKNTEWGAVAYLSKSKYGKQTEEVFINNSSDYITGNAGGTANASSASGVTNAYNTTNGQKASTTGNVYGVYDMSGGAWEYTAAYVENSYITDTTKDQYTYGKSVVDGAAKYKDVYSIGTDGDSYTGNYAAASGKYGDAVYETSSTGDGTDSWYSDCSYFPDTDYPFFIRGGNYNDKSDAGVFYFNNDNGNDNNDIGFRVVVPVLRYFKNLILKILT